MSLPSNRYNLTFEHFFQSEQLPSNVETCFFSVGFSNSRFVSALSISCVFTMPLIFFKKSDGTMEALMVDGGSIIEEGYNGRYVVQNDDHLSVCLNSMTKLAINETLDHLGMTTMPISTRKDVMIASFIRAWNDIQEGARMTRAVQVAAATLAQGKGGGKGVASASSGDASVAPFSGTPQRLGDDKPSLVGYSVELSSKGNLEGMDGEPYVFDANTPWSDGDETALKTLKELNKGSGITIDGDKLDKLEKKKAFVMSPDYDIADFIADYVDDGEVVLPQSYLDSPDDFNQCVLFHIYDPHDTKKLMTIPVSDLSESVADLKEFIVAKICEFSNKKDKKTMSKAMMVGDFRLQRYGYYLQNDGTLGGVAGGDAEVRINLILTLKGGGISSVRKVEKMKQKTIEASKVLNTMATSVGADLKTIAVVKKAEDIIGKVHQLLQSNGAEATMKGKMMELVKSAPLVAKDVVKYLKESGSGSPEVKLRHLAEKFFQCEELSQKIEEFKAVSESIKSMMTICYNKLVMEMAEKGVSNYNLTNFRETLDTMIEMASADTAVALTRDDMVLL